jgi:hypothetical protein
MFLSAIVARLKFSALGSRSSPASEMSCVDCDRVNSCGRPPHNDCEERLLQAEKAKRYNLASRPHLLVRRDVEF